MPCWQAPRHLFYIAGNLSLMLAFNHHMLYVESMIRVRKAGLAGYGIVAAGLIASAAMNDASNPYRGIVERNPFGLKPPPPPVAVEPPPSLTDKQKVMIT